MFDILRRRLPIATAAAMALALTGQAVLAQSGDEISPSAIQSINVQKVDGRSAIKYNNNPSQRGGYLVAASAAGYLPNNIILKAVDSELLDGLDSTAYATLAALKSTTGAVNEADNLVHWNQLFGVPPAVIAGDTTRSFIAGESGVIAVGGTSVLFFDRPVGLEVETTLIPTAVGAIVIEGSTAAGDIPVLYLRVSAGVIREFQFFQVFGVASSVKLRATVWNDSYISPAAARNQVKVTFLKNPKKVLNELGLR